MKDIVLLCSAFIGGLFAGYLTAILAFFVWELVKEGFSASGQMAIPVIFLLAIFGGALAYLTVLIFHSWPLFVGSAITFIYAVRPLFLSEKFCDQEKNS